MFLLISKNDRSAILEAKTKTENNASVLFLIKKTFFKKPTQTELTEDLKDELKFFKLLIYQVCFMSLYLVLFSQLDTSFIAQGMHMNAEVLGFTILPNQLPFWNTAFVLAFLPVFKWFLLPAFEKFKILNKKIDQMIAGILFVASSFLFTAWEQYEIEQGVVFSILIHAVPYTLLSIGEIFFMFVSVNYVYARAPKSMSNMCSLATNCAYLIGNIIVSIIASRFTDLCVTYFLIFASIALVLALYLTLSMRRKNMYL